MIRRTRGRRVALIAAVLGAGLVLSACSSNDTLAQQWNSASDKGYIAGDGSTTSIEAEARTEAVAFSGVDETGAEIDSADYAGSVTVVNFWYAGCPPCRAEAPDLQEVSDEMMPEGVKFLGVNTRDQEAQAIQFAKEFSIGFPSIMDAKDNRATQRAFAGQVPLNAVPTTLVLDTEGRVAHRVLGQLAGASQLRTLIKETQAEAE
ncbi:TlpA family protein disulfide reductase [Leucobacter sp. M11]|uniref:TlpA family protein disulfide reductase n=1 Tax=Leucobacter sp. M11 TaxID=2993565 RepID=UPI002D7F601F|nr:redoxin domain-containing protein [Leucobacter sp. M11]MEB4614671.1 redoxin domain-containing protein [Leucobacter sp. M11]